MGGDGCILGQAVHHAALLVCSRKGRVKQHAGARALVAVGAAVGRASVGARGRFNPQNISVEFGRKGT